MTTAEIASTRTIISNLAIGFVLLALLALANFGFQAQLAKAETQADMAALLESSEGDAEAGRNIRWATGGSLAAILDSDYGVKPPLYPALLFLAYESGLNDLILVNEALFFGVLLALGWLGRVYLAPVPLASLLIFSAVFVPFPSFFAPFRSESLFILCSLGTLLATERYWRYSSWTNLALLTLLLAITCATRYIGIFWLVPVTGLTLLLIHRENLSTGLTRASVSTAISMLPCMLYMSNQYSKTGFLTGIDRFETRFSYQNSLWQTFWFTVSDIPRVIGADFTTLRYARFGKQAPEAAVEYLIAGIVLASIVAGILLFYKTLATRLLTATPSSRTERTHFLVGVYFLSYLAVLIVLWTAGNNDPITTRFVLPMYPLLLLMLAGVTQTLVENRRLAGLAALGSFVIALAVQLNTLR